jgi:hypothetical protein
MMLQTCPGVLQAFLRAEMIIIYSYMLLYIIRIMNRYIVSLILIKYYLMLIICLILLFIIEDVICCLRELYELRFFLKSNDKRNYLKMSLLDKLQIIFTITIEMSY